MSHWFGPLFYQENKEQDLHKIAQMCNFVKLGPNSGQIEKKELKSCQMFGPIFFQENNYPGLHEIAQMCNFSKSGHAG